MTSPEWFRTIRNIDYERLNLRLFDSTTSGLFSLILFRRRFRRIRLKDPTTHPIRQSRDKISIKAHNGNKIIRQAPGQIFFIIFLSFSASLINPINLTRVLFVSSSSNVCISSTRNLTQERDLVKK